MVRFRGFQEEVARDRVDLAHLRRLWGFVRPYRRAFALALLILLVSFGVELLGPLLIRWTIDGPIAAAASGQDPDRGRIGLLGLGYLATTLAAVGLGYGYALLTTRNAQLVIRDLRVALFGHLLRTDPGFFDRNPAGKLVTRVTTDVENLNELIATGVLQTTFDLLKIAGVLGALFLIDDTLALYTVAATPIAIVVSLLFRRHARDAYRDVRGRLARQNGFLAETIGGVRTTRAFGREATVLRHAAELNADTRRSWQRTVLYFALFFAAVDLALRWCQAGLLLVGGERIWAGAMTAGVFVQFWLYFGILTDPIKELGEKYNVLQSAMASAERIFLILDRPPSPAEPAQPKPSPRGPAEVRFEGVEFAYAAGTPVLVGIDLTVPAGTTCAIVGPTGSGKTTLVSLVSRLRDPTAGRIALDGVPLPELELAALRRRVAVVPQDVFLFTGTVLDNVRLFDDAIGEERVRAALAAVGALGFVEAMAGGLHARVEERGVTFSQGERQLLSFARALVTEPDVLILDEATANIDSEAEAAVQRAMRGMRAGRTCLVVAHRLSTVRDADRIVVMRRGRIAECGTHEELLARGGLYAEMVRSV